MNHYDVFNGDADGICALHQLRLAEPKQSILITGVKRDIALLKRVHAEPGDTVTVLDVSMTKNSEALQALLEQGVEVFYVDHHQPGEIPDHDNLTDLIDTAADTCTSLLVDGYLGGRYRPWAVTAAFGDNLNQSALKAAEDLALSARQLEQLQSLGICINYNGYGSTLEDLHFHPEQLYREISPYESPFDFISDPESAYEPLKAGYQADMAAALKIKAEFQSQQIGVYILPDTAWARRVSGVFGNRLANDHPERAHAVLSYNAQGGYQISVRAPLTNKTGADELCSAFGGGGRKAAAGINHLPVDELVIFIDRFAQQYRAG